MENTVVTPRDEKNSYSLLLICLRQQTQLFTANLQLATRTNKQILKEGQYA